MWITWYNPYIWYSFGRGEEKYKINDKIFSQTHLIVLILWLCTSATKQVFVFSSTDKEKGELKALSIGCPSFDPWLPDPANTDGSLLFSKNSKMVIVNVKRNKKKVPSKERQYNLWVAVEIRKEPFGRKLTHVGFGTSHTVVVTPSRNKG